MVRSRVVPTSNRTKHLSQGEGEKVPWTPKENFRYCPHLPELLALGDIMTAPVGFTGWMKGHRGRPATGWVKGPVAAGTTVQLGY